MMYGRVLLADSHLNLLTGVHSLLEAAFDSVVMVSDEKSLLDAIAAFHPDLVIADLSLPGSREDADANLVYRLKQRYPDLRLILLSVHDDPTVAAQLLRAGAAGFVLKRSAAADLIAAVHEVLKGRQYVSSALERPKALERPDPKPKVAKK